VRFRRGSPQNSTLTRLHPHSLSVQKRRHHEGLLSAALSRSSTSLTYLSGYDAGCIILSPNAYYFEKSDFLYSWKTLWKHRTFSFSLFSSKIWDARTALGEMCCDSDSAPRKIPYWRRGRRMSGGQHVPILRSSLDSVNEGVGFTMSDEVEVERCQALCKLTFGPVQTLGLAHYSGRRR